MCRCIARNHLFAHIQAKPRNRKTSRKQGYQTISYETTQKDNSSAGDEQVYKKDLDDLIDYIMQPNGA